MGTVDLDASRAARREADKEPPRLRFGGKEYVLPIEMPLEVLDELDGFEEDMAPTTMAGAILRICQVLLGDEAYAEFRALRPSLEDVMTLLNGPENGDGNRTGGILGEYGFGSPGESPAPVDSSESTGAPLKPTSKRNTA
jgi:hypothetical protein